MQRVSARRKEDDGFTLVELLVVIVILGILAAIVVFAVGGIQNNAQTSANATDASTLRAAEEAYFASPPVGGTAPHNSYTTESGMLTNNNLRTASTNNFICLRSDFLDYFVLPAPLPTTLADGNATCAGQASGQGKAGGTFTASAGTPAVP
jgi:general secretion pathway protein G